jgi:uncharacterized protein
MAHYFVDSSALVKRHVTEPGHTWIESLCDPAVGNTIIIAERALTEVVASFCRMARERRRRLSRAARDRLIAYFDAFVPSEYVVAQINRAIFVRATALCPTHPLRAYDASQLATALAVRDDNLAAGLPVPIFVC